MQNANIDAGPVSAGRSSRFAWAGDMRLALALIASAYLIAYLLHPSVPGNRSPLGWWGWFDQGQYLLAAKAFAALDFSPDRHFYPPLYPLLGSLFVRWWEQHPFWLIDLAGLLWFSAVFLLFARRYVSRRCAAFLYAASVLLNHRVFPDFLIPWTTTVGAALLSVGIYGLLRLDDRPSGQGGAHRGAVFGVSLALGLLACLRPVDGLVGGILWLAYMARALRLERRPAGAPDRFRRPLASAVAGLAGLALGPAAFAGFNHAVFGSVRGRYVEVAAANGFFPADIAEKFVSLFFDGQALYLEPGSGIAEHFPWMALALVGLIFVLARGDRPLRVVALAVCAQFILYLPYGDLLPTGIWRFHNLHYFKWTFPYLALAAWLLLAHAARGWRDDMRKAVVKMGAVLTAAALLAALGFRIENAAAVVAADAEPSGAMSFRLKAEGGKPERSVEVDLIDVAGLQGAFADVYFGKHKLWVDGRELHHVRDFRALPAPWGVRLLFIRPLAAEAVVFQPDPGLKRSGLAVTFGRYRFALRLPAPFGKGR
ncbi:MAG TPA: hypothetical protein VEC06_15400 [Paucimonas sp.]|nr:hypothetical protein [Paucimonas sp.]